MNNVRPMRNEGLVRLLALLFDEQGSMFCHNDESRFEQYLWLPQCALSACW